MSNLTGTLHFGPNLYSLIWGGTAIPLYKNITSALTDIGESWEVSAVPGKESVVDRGPLAGQTLTQLIDRYGTDLLGRVPVERFGMRFPLLVKLIDARTDLSIQVHPDDDLALSRHGSLGKTEMWYVIDTQPGAHIRVGLREQLDPDTYTARVADSTIVDAIADYESHPGDSFFIPAGRIHAICGGNLLAEIQESSDITYRIYDYGRLDSNGRPRQLHTGQARDAIDYTVRPDYRNRETPVAPGHTRVAHCPHFTVDRHTLGSAHSLDLPGDGESFTIIMCIAGACTVATETHADSLGRGDTLLVPATVAARIHGHATILTASIC